MATSVFGIAPNELVVTQVLERLQAVGVTPNDVSALFPDKSGTRDFAHEKNTKVPEGVSAGAGLGGLLGGGLGWLVGTGALAIPGLGAFIAAGPILAALGGIATGATVGGFTGALVGLGIPEFEARQYEGKIKEGNILVSVHSRDSNQTSQIKKIFKEFQLKEVATSKEETPA